MMKSKLIIILAILLTATNVLAGILTQVKQDLIFDEQDANTIGTSTVSASSSPLNRGRVLVRKGVAGESAIVSVLESSVQLSHSDGSQLTVNNFTISDNDPFDSSKEINLRIGGTITLNGSSTAGDYSGSCTVRIYPSYDPTDIKDVTLPIEQTIISAVSITEVSSLSFPTVYSGTDNTTTILPSDTAAAEFSSTGEPGYSMVASIEPTSITLTNGSGDEITVDSFSVTSCSAYSNKGICSPINVGATVNAPAATPAGSYSGTATIKILYL